MISEPRGDHLVWLDGALVKWADATIHVSAHHYGFGVFEGLRAYATADGAALFRLADHTTRLFRSAHIINLKIPDHYDRETLIQAQKDVVCRNGLADAYVRPFVFCSGTSGLSPHTRKLSVHVAVMALEWKDDGAYASTEGKSRGLSLRTVSLCRSHPNSLFSKAKANGNYMNSVLALQEAQACGADEALILDAGGFATEASGANLFVVRDGAIYTPPRELVLEGITRDTIVTLAASFGWNVTERRMTRDEIYVADEAFLTGTAAEVTPIREIDGRRVGRGARGPMTERLQEAYSALVRGRREDHREWLSRIQ